MSQISYTAPDGLWGSAIGYTRIDDDGKMWVGNGEYETQVNYCPFTGQPAPKQMKLVDVEYKKWNSEETYTIKEYKNE
jgi:hypothetical protein